jgi:hypothetical protein
MGFEPNQCPSKLEAINKFANNMKSTLDEARAALAKLKDDMVRYYNQRRTPAPKFEVGEKVFLDASDISTTRHTKKFARQYLSPVRGCPYRLLYTPLNFLRPPTTFPKFYNAARTSSHESKHRFVTPKIV